jgi:hypothetical protein
LVAWPALREEVPMPWLLWGLRLWVIALLFWWGTLLLLKVPAPSGEGRELDARWLHREEARRQRHGTGVWHPVFSGTLVYLALAAVLLGALAWLAHGLWHG